MLVRVVRFGKRKTTKLFLLDDVHDKIKFKVYMKNQKKFEKTFISSDYIYSVIIHANFIKEESLANIVRNGKGSVYSNHYIDAYAPNLLGY